MKDILKGVLLWSTVTSILLFIMGIVSVLENRDFMLGCMWLTINILLIVACKKFISLRDFYKLSGNKFLEHND